MKTVKSVDEPEHLYLVGDVIDGWSFRRGGHWTQDNNTLVRKPNGFQDQGVDWKVLGEFPVASNVLTVQLSDHASSFAIADAVRIERATAGVHDVRVVGWLLQSPVAENTGGSLPRGRKRASLTRVRDCSITPEIFPTKGYYPGNLSAFSALPRKTFLLQ